MLRDRPVTELVTDCCFDMCSNALQHIRNTVRGISKTFQSVS